MTDAGLATDPRCALYRDAVAAARKLKSDHREYHNSDPKAFRETVRRASAQVFRLKPGPKPQRNRLTAKAARERGQRFPWHALYPKYIVGYGEMNPVTQGYAEDGFRKRVNEYLRNHPRLKLPKAIPDQDSQPEIAW